MQLDVTWASGGVIIAIILHAFYTVRWASKVEFRLTSIAESFLRLNNELDKRDAKIDAAWKQIDFLKDKVTRIEVGCHNHKKEDE